MKHFDELNKIFGIEPENPVVEVSKTDVVEVNNQTKTEDQEDDYQLARRTLRNMITKNDDVIGDLVNLAKNSEHPRTYEVVGQLVKTQSEIAKDLLGLHKQSKELAMKDAVGKVGTQNNIVFAGSTSELLKLMKQQNEKIIDNE